MENNGSGRLTSDPEITTEHHLKTATKSRSVYNGYGREQKLLQTTKRAPEVDEELVYLSLRHGFAFKRVRSRAEGVLGRRVDYGVDEERVCGGFIGGEGI